MQVRSWRRSNTALLPKTARLFSPRWPASPANANATGPTRGRSSRMPRSRSDWSRRSSWIRGWSTCVSTTVSPAQIVWHRSISTNSCVDNPRLPTTSRSAAPSGALISHRADAQTPGELTASGARQAQGAAVEILDQPFFPLCEQQQRGAERAAEMETSFGPVEAAEGKAAPEPPCRLQIEAEGGQCARATGAHFVGLAVARRPRGEPPERRKPLAQRHAHRACDVVVTSAGLAQMIGSAAYERRGAAAGEGAELFEDAGHLHPAERVVVVLALTACHHQSRGLQTLQMHAGGRGRHLGGRRELVARAGAAGHEAHQHARPRRIPHRGGNPGNGGIAVGCGVHCIHSFMLDEVSDRDNG